MSTDLERRPRPAPPLSDSAFETMKRQAVVLAKTELVPKALQGKPEALMLIGLWGAEHGVPFATAVQDVHIIENRPSPSAQLRLALIRRAGHEIRFTETSSERAVLRARRREHRHDPDAWVTVSYTIEDARKAELLDTWVERWMTPKGGDRKKKHTWKVGDDTGPADLAAAPEWVHEEIAAGQVHSKDNWRKYPADMLRARAASVMARMEFSDVMAALDVHDHTAEELGIDVGQDLDEPGSDPSGDGPVNGNDDGVEEVIEDAELVEEDLDPEPEPATHPSNPGPEPVPGETPPANPAEEPTTEVPGFPRLRNGDQEDLVVLKQRIAQGMTPAGWAGLIPWLEACKIGPTLDRLSKPRIDAIHAELDKRGVAPAPRTKAE